MKKIQFLLSALMVIPGMAIAASNVFVAPVQTKPVYDVIESVGTVKAFNSVVVTSEVSSKVTKIHFKEGQEVQEGDLLFTLDNKEEKADLAAAESAFIQKKKAYDRAKNLVKTNVISDATFQERESEYETEKANVQAVKARLDLQEIRAPFSGSLGIVDLSVGEYIQAGESMVNLSDLTKMKLDFFIPSRFLSSLKVGDTLEATSNAYDKVFKGQISFVDQQVDQITRTVRVRAIIQNPEKLLKDGMLMTIKTYTNERQSKLIPEEAVIKRGENNFVFVAVTENEKSIAKYKQIEIGSRYFGEVEVLKGLEEGEDVIHHGIMSVKDGSEVVIKFKEVEEKTLQQMLKN